MLPCVLTAGKPSGGGSSPALQSHTSLPLSAGVVSGKQGAQVGRPFMEVAYGYLPLVWAATLSHYLLLFLGEAGRILPVCIRARRCSRDTLYSCSSDLLLTHCMQAIIQVSPTSSVKSHSLTTHVNTQCSRAGDGCDCWAWELEQRAACVRGGRLCDRLPAGSRAGRGRRAEPRPDAQTVSAPLAAHTATVLHDGSLCCRSMASDPGIPDVNLDL